MNFENIKARLIRDSKVDTLWLNEAKWRQENESWLDISFSIAVRTLAALKAQKMSQKTLSEKIGCTPQYINKLLKGTENLQLETIFKLENALHIKLIEVPRNETYIGYSLKANTSNSINIGNKVLIEKTEETLSAVIINLKRKYEATPVITPLDNNVYQMAI